MAGFDAGWDALLVLVGTLTEELALLWLFRPSFSADATMEVLTALSNLLLATNNNEPRIMRGNGMSHCRLCRRPTS